MSSFADRLSQDLRYAARGLRRSPPASILAVVLLSLGIGLNASVAIILDRLFVRTPPGVSNPAMVRRVHQHFTVALTHDSRIRQAFSYVEVQAMERAFAPIGRATHVGAFAATRVPMATATGLREVGVTYVLDDYFGTLGIRPALGRLFRPEEVGRDGPVMAVVLSDHTWEREFGRDSAVIGKSVMIGTWRFVVIGIAPRAFRGVALEEADYWVPFNAQDFAGSRPFDTPMDIRFNVLVRTTSPADRAAAGARLTNAVREVNLLHDDAATIRQVPLAEALDPQNGKSTVGVVTRLAGATLIVLVLACANVANLLLIRLSRRRREIAIRFALGTSRSRLASQLLTEGLLLALFASVPAALTAGWGFSALTRWLMPEVTFEFHTVVWRGLGIVVSLAALGGLMVSLLPVLYLRDPDLTTALRGAGNTTPHASRFRASLLVMQTVLSVVLLAASGLFVRSLTAVEQLGFGYQARNVLFASIETGLYFRAVTPGEVNALGEAVSRIAALPGVRSVATTSILPISEVAMQPIYLPDRDSVPNIPGVSAWMSAVSPGFLGVTGITLLRGRDFTGDDRAGSDPVVLVSKAMAAQYWPGEDALTKCLIVGRRRSPCRRVIGVVADVRTFKIFERQSLRLYLPTTQEASRFARPKIAAVALDTNAPPLMRTRIQQLLTGNGGGGLHWRLTSMAELIDPEMRPWRLSATLVAMLGIVAAVVTGIGTYGTTSYTVGQRLHELSVRRVLGAQTCDVVSLVLASTMRLVAAGAVIGVVLVLALGPSVKSMLYGVSGHDPWILGVAVLLQIAGAVAACVVPALSAARAAPAAALASE